jgi:hypothetical protein
MPEIEPLRVKALFDVGDFLAGFEKAAVAVEATTTRSADAFTMLAGASIVAKTASMEYQHELQQLAQAGLAPTAEQVEELAKKTFDLQVATDAMKAAHQEAYPALEQTARSANNARSAFMGLNSELGLHGNRALGAFISQSQTLGPILNAAFTGVAIFGFIQLATTAGEKLAELISETFIFTAAEKALSAQLTADNQTVAHNLEEQQKIIRDMEVLGKPLAEAERMRAVWAMEDARGIQGQIAAKEKLLAAARQELAIAQQKKEMGGSAQVTGDETLAMSMEDLDKPIEDANVKITQLSSSIDALKAQYATAALSAESLDKKAAIEAQKEAEKKAAAEERAAQKVLEAWHKKVIAEIDDDERAAKEKIRIAEESAKITKEFNKNMEEEEKRLNAEIVRDQARALEEVIRNQKKELEEEKRIAKLREKPWNDLFAGINRGTDQMVRGIISGTESIGRVFTKMGVDLLSSTASWLANILLKHLEHWALVNIIEKNAMLQSLTTFITGTTAKQAVQATSNVAQVTSNAGLCAAAAFASVMESLPIPINVSVAPGVAAATVAQIESYTALAAFEKGGIMAKDDIAFLHAREMVLPAHISDALVNATSGHGSGLGGVTLNYHQNNSGFGSSAKDDLNQAGKAFLRHAIREMRRLNRI